MHILLLDISWWLLNLDPRFGGLHTYTTKELKMKFILTVPNHLEPSINSLRDRDLTKVSYDVPYGVINTHELELLQKRAIQANQGSMVNTSCDLIVDESLWRIETVAGKLRLEEVNEGEGCEEEHVVEKDEDEFYTMAELGNMDKKLMLSWLRSFQI